MNWEDAVARQLFDTVSRKHNLLIKEDVAFLDSLIDSTQSDFSNRLFRNDGKIYHFILGG